MNKIIYTHKQLLKMNGQEIEVLYWDNFQSQYMKDIKVNGLTLQNIERIVVYSNCGMVHIDFVNCDGLVIVRKRMEYNSVLQIDEDSIAEYKFIKAEGDK